MAGEVSESFVQEMNDFSHRKITDVRLWMSVAFTNSRVKAGRRGYPASSLTAILQPPDHMSELIVFILSVIGEPIDRALDIIKIPLGLLADGRQSRR
jgi:hypothetical protein